MHVKTRAVRTNWFSEEAPFWLKLKDHHGSSITGGLLPSTLGPGQSRVAKAHPVKKRFGIPPSDFFTGTLTVYVPFWFEANPLESMWRLLIKDFMNHPTGITVRRGSLWFYVSCIIPAKDWVFPTGCIFSSATSSPDMNYLFERASILNRVPLSLNIEQSRVSRCLITQIHTDNLWSTFKGTPSYTESLSKLAQEGKNGSEGSNKIQHLFDKPVSHLDYNSFCEVINQEES